MKRTMACILMLGFIVLLSYSLNAYAEETKPISGSELSKSYVGKNIKELIDLLGKPNEVKEKREKYARPGSEVIIYIWDWNEIDKLPVKIIHDLQEGTTPYYVDFIKAKAEGGEITVLNLKAQNKFAVP